MTTSEFDVSTSSPRRGTCRADRGSASFWRKRWNGQRRAAPVEALSARIFRLRIGHGYSVYELAAKADLSAAMIKRLESGESGDKRVLAAIAAALGVPLCQLVCGEHSCAQRACIALSAPGT
jgi:ribosome-binding protein aMBF1 (putative translation factor)